MNILTQMEPGDQIVCADDGVVSRAIRFATGGDVSHVASVLSNGALGPMIVETSSRNWGTVGIVSMQDKLDLYREQNARMWWLKLRKPLSDAERKAYRHALMTMVGAHYSPLQALISVLPWVTNSEKYPRVFCSRIASYALEQGGAFDGDINSAEVTPQDLVCVRLWGDCRQLCGDPRSLTGYNSMPVEKWRKEILDK